MSKVARRLVAKNLEGRDAVLIRGALSGDVAVIFEPLDGAFDLPVRHAQGDGEV
jgi:hypothetical protein